MSSIMKITDLPDECISHILSLTSARDVIRSSVVSKQFLAVSESDAIWNKFLPSKFDEIVSHSSAPHVLQQFDSKKELYFHLCSNPILFNGDTQSFALNKWNGKKCYMLGARALKIIWGDTPHYWTWKYLPESRFPEVAKLLHVWWLLIEANISPSILSPNTNYGVYFVFKVDVPNYGFEFAPVKLYVFEVLGEDELSGLPPPRDVPFKLSHIVTPSADEDPPLGGPGEDLPVARDDGWMEIEMGRYYVKDSIDEGMMLRMTLLEIDAGELKSGLVVQGIELRPVD